MIITLGDQLEEQFRRLAVELHTAQLVDHQESWTQVDPPLALQMALELRLFQVRDKPGDGGIADHYPGV